MPPDRVTAAAAGGGIIVPSLDVAAGEILLGLNIAAALCVLIGGGFDYIAAKGR